MLRRLLSSAVRCRATVATGAHLMSPPSLKMDLPPLSLETIQALPKAELHCHLDGSVRPSTVHELAIEQGVSEYASMPLEELESIIQVSPDCRSLVEYLQGFDVTLSVMQTEYAISRCMYEVCEDAYRDGVRYLEVRFSPILHTWAGLHLSSIMEAVIDGMAMAEHDFAIIPRVIVCGMRQLESSVTAQLAEIAWRYKNQGVVSFDLAGPEIGFSSKLHQEAFELLHQRGLNCTLHSGEAAGWESIHDSLRYCGAQRIGHGVHARDNQAILDWIINRSIPIECCVTSNVQTVSVDSFEDHPIRDFFDAGAVVVPCTDNTTVGGYTLSDEYFKLQNLYDFSVPEMIRLLDYGFGSAFLPKWEKRRLRMEVMQDVLDVLTGVEGLPESVAEEALSLASDTMFAVPFEILQVKVGESGSGILEQPSQKRLYTGHASDVEASTEGVITLDLMEKLPKADCNCRLVGSVSIEQLWENCKELQVLGELHEDELKLHRLGRIETIDDLRDIIQPGTHDVDSIKKAVNVMKLLLQSKKHITAGVKDVFAQAEKENIRYLELHVRPTLHTRNLSASEVLDSVLEAVKVESAKTGIKCGVAIDVSTRTDGIHQIYEAALLAVHRSDEIVGFGLYGSDPVFGTSLVNVMRMLKNNEVLVSVFCGKEDPTSIPQAIHQGGASRLSGCFTIDQDPGLMDYVAGRNFPIEIGMTDKLRGANPEIDTFAGTIFRFLLDRDCELLPCSFDKTLYPTTRTEDLYSIAESSNLSVKELLLLLSFGFKAGFLPLKEREELYREFWDESKKVLEANGFHQFKPTKWFPKSE